MSGGYALYIGDHPLKQPNNPFGKDIANRGMFRALVEHGPWPDQLFLVHNRVDERALGRNLFDGSEPPKPIRATSIMNHREIATRGALFRGQARLAELAWLRREAGDRSYSITGLVHSLAPQAMRAYTAEVISSPIEPWDALICTSPAVERHLRTLFDEVSDYMGARFAPDGARRERPLPQLPVIPLGVDCDAMAARGDPAKREEARRTLAVGDNAFVLLWVGRLSFFEKAYPQPMFAAAEETAQRIGRPVEFLMTGWFPDGEQGRARWEAAAALYAPNVTVRFLDGNDPEVLSRIWSAADVFVSLVDNIQETFGITPIEAMAAGLPVVVSDWDGYRATVPHGVAGFRIPTLIAPSGAGVMVARRHAIGIDSYQSYVANVAAHVAVNIRLAADALSTIANDGNRAASMRREAMAHARATFDWPVIVRQYADLHGELTRIREDTASFEGEEAARINPVRNDPFTAFAGFATQTVENSTVLSIPATDQRVNVAEHHEAALNKVTGLWRLPQAVSVRIVELVGLAGSITAQDMADSFPDVPHDSLARHLTWMCKIGMLDWASPTVIELDRLEDR